MRNPVTLLIRHIMIRRHASHAPHGILPLSRIRCATVLVDPEDTEAEAVCSNIEQYFGERNISLHICRPVKKDLSIIGCMKNSCRGEGFPDRDAELFISLMDREDNFLSDYESSRSRAAFKIGRRQLPGKVFDIVVSDPEGSKACQEDVFEFIKEYLGKII